MVRRRRRAQLGPLASHRPTVRGHRGRRRGGRRPPRAPLPSLAHPFTLGRLGDAPSQTAVPEASTDAAGVPASRAGAVAVGDGRLRVAARHAERLRLNRRTHGPT